MSAERSFEAVMRMLKEPAFAGLAREAVRDYVSPGELANREIPEGLTTQQTWELLSTIRRLGATTFPIPVATGEQFWYTVTVEGTRCLRTIERHCHSDSRLHQMIQHRTGRRFLVKAQVQEAIATCQTDGVETDVAELKRMLNRGYAPTTPEARLVRNTYEMLSELESLVDEDFSPELVIHLFERATHGVDPGGMTVRSDTGIRGVPSVFQELMKQYRPPGIGQTGTRADEAAEALQQICDYANGRSGDPRESVAVKGYMLLAAMGYWHPLPDFNATVARHMLRLLSVKRDFPVLGYLPISVMMRKWAQGQMMDRSAVRYSTIEPAEGAEGSIDGTAEILVHLQLTVAAINGLRTQIELTKEEDEALGRTLRRADRFNYRQRSLLNHALRCPEAEYTLREHRLTHRTVYSTARADLLELVDEGLLRKQTRGQAFVFTPAPDLRDRLSQGWAVEE